MKLIYVLGIGLFILFAFIATQMFLAPKNQPETDEETLKVLATFFPLYDFTRNIAQHKIGLELLFTQTPEVSSFSPADIQKVNRADMIIKNGVGFEPVLDELMEASDNKNVIVVDTSDGVKLLDSSEEENANDPHVWLNPQNAILQVENIKNALSLRDPANAAFYRQNAQAYVQKLMNLDARIQQETFQFITKDFVSFHPAFMYFAKRYGLNQAAVIEEFPGKEPSPQYLAQLIDTIKALGVTALFSEPQFSPRVVQVIAKDLGLQVYALNPVETGIPSKDSYLGIMEENLETLKQAMK